jgi:hypothetical protein
MRKALTVAMLGWLFLSNRLDLHGLPHFFTHGPFASERDCRDEDEDLEQRLHGLVTQGWRLVACRSDGR